MTNTTHCIQDMFTALNNMDRNVFTADFWKVLHDILLTKIVNLSGSFHARRSAPTNDEAQQTFTFLWCRGRQ